MSVQLIIGLTAFWLASMRVAWAVGFTSHRHQQADREREHLLELADAIAYTLFGQEETPEETEPVPTNGAAQTSRGFSASHRTRRPGDHR